jgi:hypothetical protein
LFLSGFGFALLPCVADLPGAARFSVAPLFAAVAM